jgi:uncharacterized protein (TIGR02996 family)
MSDQEAFMRAIIAAPDDDAPRLVYADWLDENGEPERAELIRVQCEAARTPEWDPRYDDLKNRSFDLLEMHAMHWLPNLVEGRPLIRRGMVEGYLMAQDEFHRSAEGLFATLPIRQIDFLPVTNVLELVLDRHARRLRSIGVRAVDANANFDPRAGLPSREWPVLEELVFLGLRLRAEDLQDILTFASFPTLKLLNFVRSPLGADGAALIAHSFPALVSLTLSADADTDYRDRLRAGGARELARAPELGRLRSLKLENQLIGDAGLRHLAESPHLGNMEILDLKRNDIGAIGTTGIEEFAAAGHFPKLRWLRLNLNQLNLVGIRELLAWPGLAQLRKLDLAYCGIAGAGGRLLATVPGLHPDLRLDLRGNDLGHAVDALRHRFGDRVRLGGAARG